MKLAHDDFLIAPDEELRECYKSAKRMQRLLALPLLLAGVLFAMSVIDLITDILRMGHFSSSVADGVFAFAMGAAFVSMTSVFSEEPRRQTVLALVPLTVQVLLYPALLILGSKEGTHDKVLGDLQHAGIPVGAGQMTLQLVMILLSIIVFLLGRPVIRDIAHIVATMQEDYDLAREWYGVRGDFTPCYELYPYADDYGDGEPARTAEGKLTLLLGNSASRTNEHEEAIDLLASRTGNIRKVFCPLSYGGSRRYAERVRKHGKEVLGDLFEPLMDYLPFDEYKQIWDSTDVGVYNQKRQEALGNIFSLIMKKRTVYLRPEMPMSRFFARLGVVTPALDRDCEIKELPADVREKNAETLFSYIDPDRSCETWKKILEDGGETA